MAGISFNTIPGSGLVAPIQTFEFNSGGSPTNETRAILLGHKTSAGSLATATPTVCTSLGEADALAGPGSMLREMYRIFAQNAPAQTVYLVAVAETGVAPTWTYTVANVPAAGGSSVFDICGERLTVTVGAGDSTSTVAAAHAAAINAYYNPLTGARLPVTASVSSAVFTVTGRHAGAIMGDIDHYLPTEVAGNIAPTILTIAAGTAASGVPSLAAALAAIGDDPADFTVSPWADTASLDTYQTWLSDASGRWAWSRQVYGHVFACNTGNTSAQTTLGLARNDRHVTIIPRLVGSAEPSWLWASGFAGAVAPWLSDITTGNVSRNQTGLVVQGLHAPRDRSTLWGYQARNTFLQSGISTWTATRDGKVAIDKLVTGYRTGPLGQPDKVFRDIQRMFQLSGGFGYVRSVVQSEHGQKAIMDTNPGALGAVSTPADIKATQIHAYEELEKRGVFENAVEFAKRLQVKRNADNDNRVDNYYPVDAVNSLDILAVNATIYAQYR